MRTLQEYLERMNGSGGKGQSLKKHLSAVGIKEWADITRGSLYELRDHLADTLAPNSQRTVMANFKSLLNRVKDDVDIPKDFDKILVAKSTQPLKTYLTEEDLDKFQKVKPNTLRQEFVKNVFLICAYTGLRVSDAMHLTSDNIEGNNLHYIAQKTKKPNAIPLKPSLVERIKWISEHKEYNVSLVSYNITVRKLCKKAGIDEEVVVFKAGKEKKGPKWKFVSSHTARISMATCLDRRGVKIGDIKQLLQHSSVQITERYIVRDRIELSENAMEFFA